MNVVEGTLLGMGLKVAVVVSRFNDLVTEQLLKGAEDAFRRHGVKPADIDAFRCPGTFEIGPLLKRVAQSGRYDAVLALGAVIRGGTSNYEFVSAETVKAVALVAMEADCAVSLGVLTCDTMEQALERAGMKAGNKGAEAAVAALEQANVFREADKLPASRRAE